MAYFDEICLRKFDINYSEKVEGILKSRILVMSIIEHTKLYFQVLEADAKSTPSYFLGPTSIGIIL